MEAQIEMAEARSTARPPEPLNPEQITRQRQKEVLHLTRKRVLRDLESSANPRYQEMLTQALQHLDRQLAELG